MKDAEIHLGSYKQGDDMSIAMQLATNDEKKERPLAYWD